MSKPHHQVATFQLEGRFLGYDVENGYKIKRLHLATATGEQTIKLSKEARVALGRVLAPGEWIEVRGLVKRDRLTGYEKLKAFSIRPIACHSAVVAPAVERAPVSPTHRGDRPEKPQTILMFQKSDCMKRGGKSLCPALEAELRDRGLADHVTIRGTGCMKQCKAGPNLIMPDKTRHSRLTPADVPALLDQYFPGSKSGAPSPSVMAGR